MALVSKGQYLVPDYIQNYDNTKPAVYAIDLGGGYQQVSDSTAKADLSSDKRVVGMMVSFKEAGVWVTDRYEGTDVLTVNWINYNNWRRIALSGDEVFIADTLKANEFTIDNVPVVSSQWYDVLNGIAYDNNVTVGDSLNVSGNIIGDTIKARFNSDSLYNKDFINVRQFGAVGDGITDDAIALQNAFDYARDNDKNIILEKDRHYITSAQRLQFYGGILEGNNSTLETTYNSSGVSETILCAGIQESFYNLDSDVGVGTDIIYISNSTFLNSLSVGDMVKVTSNKDFYTASIKQGETAIITKIAVDTVFLAGKLYDTYLVSDGAKIQRIDYISPVIRNLNIIQNKDKSMPNGADGTFGIRTLNTKNALIDNCNILWARYSAIQHEDAYAPVTRNCKVQAADLTGLGYGVALSGAVTNSIVDGLIAQGIRHSVTHGGNIGVPHNSLVTNSTGDSRFSVHIFDTHADCGNVTFNNCTAIGGVLKQDRELFKGVWSIGTLYNQTEIVDRNGALYEAIPVTTTGDDPESSENWVRYITSTYGFLVLSDNASIINCKTINCYSGLVIANSGRLISNTYINGLTCNNSQQAFNLNNNNFDNFYINNIYVNNNTYKNDSWLLRIINCTIDNVKFGNFDGKNIGGIYIDNLEGDYTINSISCAGRGIEFINIPVNGLSLKLNTLNFTDLNLFNSIVLDDPNLKLLDIRNINLKNQTKIFAQVSNTTNNIKFGNINAQLEAGFAFLIHVSSTLDNLLIDNIYLTAPADKIAIRNDGTITNAKIGSLFGDISTDYLINRPVNEIINGDFDNPIISTSNNITSIDSLNTTKIILADSSAIAIASDNDTLATMPIVRELIVANSGLLTGVTTSTNTALGSQSLNSLTTGFYNTVSGYQSGLSITEGFNNTIIGQSAGATLTTGDNNTFVGAFAGNGTTGDGNIFIGNTAGENETGSDNLYIDNTNTVTPLIEGDFSTDEIIINGGLTVTTTTSAFIVPRMTTAERTALTGINGMIVYDTDLTAFYFYENGAWVTK